MAMPAKPTFYPQPWRGKNFTLLPISSNPDMDRGPLHSFVATTLPIASREGHGSEMPVCVKLPPCFRSSKRAKTELIWEPALARGPLWKNTHYIERNASSEMVPGQTRKPLCQELTINLAGPGGKLKYMPTEQGHPPPLTLAACHPGWDDYFDITETVAEMANRLMEEDRQQAQMPPKAGTTPKQKDVAQITALPPNDDTTLVSAAEFPGSQIAGSSQENPVHLSDATDASVSGSCPMKDVEMEDEAIILGHFSDALSEMAASIVGLEMATSRPSMRSSSRWRRPYVTCHALMHITLVVW